MEVYGYFLSALIGLSLGLLGAGGSILTVPLLVYFFKVDTNHAVRYSLFIVAMSSIAALIPKIGKREILIKQGALFASVSLILVYISRVYITPKIPEVIYQSGSFYLTYSSLSMILFSLLMICAAMTTLNNGERDFEKRNNQNNHLLIFCSAVSTGLLTGLLGAGGGFIIVPVLMSFFGISIQKAIGTSLFIIAINSIVGFLAELNQKDTDWLLILNIAIISLIGSYVGHRISLAIDAKRMKVYFGWFVTVLAICILTAHLADIYYLLKIRH